MFRSVLSEGSVKKESVTDAGTNVRDGHSNMSVMSNLETEDMEDEEEDTHDQLSVDLHEVPRQGQDLAARQRREAEHRGQAEQEQAGRDGALPEGGHRLVLRPDDDLLPVHLHLPLHLGDQRGLLQSQHRPLRPQS